MYCLTNFDVNVSVYFNVCGFFLFFCSIHIERDATAGFYSNFLLFVFKISLSGWFIVHLWHNPPPKKKTLKQNRNKSSKQKEPLVFC